MGELAALAEGICFNCDHGIEGGGYMEASEYDDDDHACKECITTVLQAEREMCARVLAWMADRAVAEADQWTKPAMRKAALETAEVMQLCATAVRDGNPEIRAAIRAESPNA